MKGVYIYKLFINHKGACAVITGLYSNLYSLVLASLLSPNFQYRLGAIPSTDATRQKMSEYCLDKIYHRNIYLTQVS